MLRIKTYVVSKFVVSKLVVLKLVVLKLVVLKLVVLKLVVLKTIFSKTALSKLVPMIIFCIIWTLPYWVAATEEDGAYEKNINLMTPIKSDVDKRSSVVEDNIKMQAPVKSNVDIRSPVKSNVDIRSPVKSNVDIRSPVKNNVDMQSPVGSNIDIQSTIKNNIDMRSTVEGKQVKKQYEINMLPSALVKSPREGASAIVVEKDSQTIRVYTSKNGVYLKALETACSTGEVDGPKMLKGDKKTPEGIYFFKQAHEDRFLTPIYGKRAFTTDYPNFFDRLRGRTGSAIWIHGTNKILKPMDSNGCVAMNNDDVVKLDSYIVLDETPIIIMDRVDYVSHEANITQKIAILDFLSKWIYSLNKGSYLEHLFHYSPDYLPDVRWWSEWINIRSRTALAGNPVSAQFDNVGIYRYKDYLVVLLEFKVSSTYRTISLGKRKLFIRPHISAAASYSSASTNTAATTDAATYNTTSAVATTNTNTTTNTASRSAVIANGEDSYKIIGDIFQTTEMHKSNTKDNRFITAASQLDGITR
ncbi:MAG: L,D-transpeptidase family protein [Desulfamplus sp.]|nr:L,D-transpeptidase family protein [Desulfamplus sp.]